MKALILAAGLGSRLRHKTKNQPKALILVRKKPIIEYQIEALVKQGILDVVIVTGYKGEQIQSFVRHRFPQTNFTFVSNELYDQSNSSYSFWLARNLVRNQTHIHLNCDIIFSDRLLSQVIQAPCENAIAVRTDLHLGDKMENVVLDDNGKIIKMTIHNIPEAVGKAFGLAKLSPASTEFISQRLSDYLDRGDKNQNYYGMIREAVSVLDYYAVLSDRYNLLEVNTLEDHNVAEQIVSTKGRFL